VKKQAGKVRLVKIDVDKNPAFAGQLRVQSIPTVYAFWQGPARGRLPGRAARLAGDAFVQKLAALGRRRRPDRGHRGGRGDAGGGRGRRRGPDLRRHPAGGAREPPRLCGPRALDDPRGRPRPGRGDPERRPAAITGKPEMEAVRRRSRWRGRPPRPGRRGAACAGGGRPRRPPGALRPRHGAPCQGGRAGAVDELLEIFRRDREWDGARPRPSSSRSSTRLPPKDPVALAGRRKLSSLIFA
jgi:putative thioredoxin